MKNTLFFLLISFLKIVFPFNFVLFSQADPLSGKVRGVNVIKEPCPADELVEKFDLTNPFFNTPIELSEKEKQMMKLNNPVVIEYLARPEQVAILMEH